MKLVGYLFVEYSMIIQVDPSPKYATKENDKLSRRVLNKFAGAAQATGDQIRIKNTKFYLLEFIYEYSGKRNLAKNYTQLYLPLDNRTQTIEFLTP